MPELDIEEAMVNNELIGRWMGIEPEIEYCVGNDTGSCFHPKQCDINWPPAQKRECERWISESQWAKEQGYEVKKDEWWPWYNQDWNKLIGAWYHFLNLRFPDPMDQFKHSELKTTVGYAILYGEIKLAYENLVEAIKWYNSK